MGNNAHLFFMKHILLSIFLSLLLTSPAKAEGFASPIQTPIPTQHISLPHGLGITQSTFQADVQILSTNMYADEWKGAIAPFDIAVGWGPISTYQALSDLQFTQSDRFYFWNIPETSRETWNAPKVILHSTNIHIIPANQTIHNRLLTIRAGDKVRLSGYLVDVAKPDGLVWLTSLRRDDTGPGACEILYLTHIDSLNTTSDPN